MPIKYYTQFVLRDPSFRGGNEFSGVVELRRALDPDSEAADIEAVLAENFRLERDSVTLLRWARLH